MYIYVFNYFLSVPLGNDTYRRNMPTYFKTNGTCRKRHSARAFRLIAAEQRPGALDTPLRPALRRACFFPLDSWKWNLAIFLFIFIFLVTWKDERFLTSLLAVNTSNCFPRLCVTFIPLASKRCFRKLEMARFLLSFPLKMHMVHTRILLWSLNVSDRAAHRS